MDFVLGVGEEEERSGVMLAAIHWGRCDTSGLLEFWAPADRMVVTAAVRDDPANEGISIVGLLVGWRPADRRVYVRCCDVWLQQTGWR